MVGDSFSLFTGLTSDQWSEIEQCIETSHEAKVTIKMDLILERLRQAPPEDVDKVLGLIDAEIRRMETKGSRFFSKMFSRDKKLIKEQNLNDLHRLQKELQVSLNDKIFDKMLGILRESLPPDESLRDLVVALVQDRHANAITGQKSVSEDEIQNYAQIVNFLYERAVSGDFNVLKQFFDQEIADYAFQRMLEDALFTSSKDFNTLDEFYDKNIAVLKGVCSEKQTLDDLLAEVKSGDLPKVLDKMSFILEEYRTPALLKIKDVFSRLLSDIDAAILLRKESILEEIALMEPDQLEDFADRFDKSIQNFVPFNIVQEQKHLYRNAQIYHALSKRFSAERSISCYSVACRSYQQYFNSLVLTNPEQAITELQHLETSIELHPEDTLIADIERHLMSGNPELFIERDATSVRNMQMEFLCREKDDGSFCHQMEFELTSVQRDYFEECIQSLIEHGAQYGISVEKDKFSYSAIGETGKLEVLRVGVGEAWKITIDGLGTLTIGSDQEQGGLYRNVRLEMLSTTTPFSADVIAKHMHNMCVRTGLVNAMAPTTDEDILWQKRALLLWRIHPEQSEEIHLEIRKATTDFRREWLRLPLNIRKDVEELLPQMKKKEIRPGRSEWVIEDLVSIGEDCGLAGFCQTFYGGGGGGAGAKVAAMIFANGSLSTQQRFLRGTFTFGVSIKGDIERGSYNQHFVRALTSRAFDISFPIENLAVKGDATILWSRQLAERVSAYGYNGDLGGARNRHYKGGLFAHRDTYETRSTVEDMYNENNDNYFCPANEVCFNSDTGPQYIVAIVVKDDGVRDNFISIIRDEWQRSGLQEQEVLRGRTLEDMIVVGENFDQRLKDMLDEDMQQRTGA